MPTMELDAFALDREILGTPSQPHVLADSTRSASSRHYFFAIVTEMRLRPLARRRRSTSRPPRVFLRARKPCVRLRLLLWGWYVRLLTASLRRLRSGIDTRPRRGCQVADCRDVWRSGMQGFFVAVRSRIADEIVLRRETAICYQRRV